MEINALSGTLLIIGTLLLLPLLANLFSVRKLAAFLKHCVLLALLLLCVGSLLTGLDLLNYRQLLEEEEVATLYFKKEGRQQFLVTISYKGQQEGRDAEQLFLRGDEWQLDIRLLKWNNRLVRLGLKPFYHLDRISGRYRDIEQAISSSRTVHSLYKPVAGLDSWELSKDLPWIQRLVDSRYGSGAYLPMADGAAYQVKIGLNGLIAKPINPAAEQAVQSW